MSKREELGEALNKALDQRRAVSTNPNGYGWVAAEEHRQEWEHYNREVERLRAEIRLLNCA